MRTALATWCVALLSVVPADHTIDWHTIDGGGGTCSGGTYQIRGTIGQPDASPIPMTGDGFSLVGGFWTAVAVAVQVPGTPTLRIQRMGSNSAMISWVPDAAGWVLQESPTLAPANWVNCPSGSTNPVTVPTTLQRNFYRLSKP